MCIINLSGIGRVTTSYYVGIDVSKDLLDVCVRPTGEFFQVSNDKAGIAKLRKKLQPLSPERVVMEATGGYEAEAALTLRLAGMKVCVVNPVRVRNFAKADGQLAKTDKIDATVLAQLLRADLVPEAWAPGEKARELRIALRERMFYVRLRTMAKNGSSGRSLGRSWSYSVSFA